MVESASRALRKSSMAERALRLITSDILPCFSFCFWKKPEFKPSKWANIQLWVYAASVSTPAHQSNPRLTEARTKPQLSQASPQPSSEYICIFVYIYKYTYTYIVPICITYTIYVYCSLFSLSPVVF